MVKKDKEEGKEFFFVFFYLWYFIHRYCMGRYNIETSDRNITCPQSLF